jgi:hypothetical protein
MMILNVHVLKEFLRQSIILDATPWKINAPLPSPLGQGD